MPIEQTELAITVERSWHGPFERISLSAHPDRMHQGLSPFREPGTDPSTSVYRVGDVLIGSGASRFVFALIAALRRQDAPAPTRVLLTHHHEDHAGGLRRLKQAFADIAIYAPRPLAHFLKGTPRALPPYREDTWGRIETITDVHAVDDGDLFSTSLLTLRAVSTPGHCPGHVSFLAQVDSETYVVSGDAFGGGSPLDAWYETSAVDSIASLRRLASRTSTLRLLPVRGRVRKKGAEALRAAAERIGREMEHLQALSAHTSIRDYWKLAEEAYGDDPMSELTGGEFGHVCFVRSVLDPVRSLPADPLPRPLQLRLI